MTVSNTYCSCRRPRFNSQPLHDTSQPDGTPVPGASVFCSGHYKVSLCIMGSPEPMYTMVTHTYNPSVGDREREGHPWGFLTSQTSGIDEFQYRLAQQHSAQGS